MKSTAPEDRIPVWAYAWAFPTTSIGLLMTLVTLVTGGKVTVVKGVLEVHGPATNFFLRRIVGLTLRGGASAMTLGHVVIARDAQCLDLTRDHERVHVRQCERWGPFFIPLYFLASLAAWAKGGNAYSDNCFEREAYLNDRRKRVE